MSAQLNRRIFLRHLLATAGSLAALSGGLTACSTLDEYLFEDRYDLKDQVLIIGGGISGLYLAYLLKQNKTEFRLFEGSSRFGGRIRSLQNYDLGASLFAPQDEKVHALLKDFGLTAESLDKKNLFLSGGFESLTSHLIDRVSGLMPYRNLRLQWQLMSIRKTNGSYELVFETPHGRRTFVSKRIALAIPPSRWSAIPGLLELPEMKESREWMKALKTENIVKAVIPSSIQPRTSHMASKSAVTFFEDSLFDVRQTNKKFKNQRWIEVDFNFREPGQSLEIQKLNDFMKRKMGLNFNYTKLSTDHYFDWRETSLIGAAYFKNSIPWPTHQGSYFQVIGDFANLQNPNTVEGALLSAAAASEKMI